jgi:hypothetical protein
MNRFWTWPDARAIVLVHLACVAMAGYAGWFVVKYGSSGVPICDEWHLLAEWTTENDTVRWAGRHHFEHRYPLGKLVWIITLQASGWNFRAPMVLTVGLLAASSVLLIWTARLRRGVTRYSDVFFPMLLLHLGHQFNLTMGYQVTFALFVYAVAGWVWCATRFDVVGKRNWLIFACLYAVAGLLSGGFGLVFTVPFVLWCAVVGWKNQRWLWAVGLLAAAYSVWVWFTRLPTSGGTNSPAHGVLDILQGTWCYIATGLGDWHIAYPWQTYCVLGVTLVVWLLGVFSIRRGKPGTLACLCVLLLLIGLGSATTLVRGIGFGTRFVSPSALGLAVAVLMFTTARKSRWIDSVAILLGLGLLWLNHGTAIRYGYQLRKACEEFRSDADYGLSAEVLQGKYEGTLMVVVGGLADDIRTLKENPYLKLYRIESLPPYTTQPVLGITTPFDYDCPADRVPKPPILNFPVPPSRAIALRLTLTTTQAPGWQRVLFSDGDWQYETFTPWVPSPRLRLVVPVPKKCYAITMKPLTHIAGFRVEAAEWLVGE